MTTIIKTSIDSKPIYDLLVSSHDNTQITFDGYNSSGWKSSSTSTAFQIDKSSNKLNFSYATAPVDSALTFTPAISIDSTGLTTAQSLSLTGLSGILKATTGLISGSATTDDLTEGKINLYYTDIRARSAISAGNGISYDNTTGIIQNIGTGSNVSLYFNYSITSASPNTLQYKELSTTPDLLSASSLATTITSAEGNKLITGFLTIPSYPNQTFIPMGEWMIDMYASKSAASPTIMMYFTVSKFDAITEAETLLLTSDPFEITSTTMAKYNLAATMGVVSLTSTDRILIKLWCNSNKSATYTLTTYYEDGQQASHMHTSLSFISSIQGLILPTTNQTTVTNTNATKVTIGTVQDIANVSSPTFAGLTLTAFSGVLKATAGVLASSATTDDLTQGLTNKYLNAISAGTGISINGSYAISNSGVLSLTGTANQVLINGTSGTATTGAITLTLPQNIGTGSSPTFA